ncbi:surface antigen [Acidiphilium sp. JA12-A1]|nr:surface antigen [Acidiphilium sp. JA12-A1]
MMEERRFRSVKRGFPRIPPGFVHIMGLAVAAGALVPVPTVHAADPQPYDVTFVPTGDAPLDKLIRQSSSLETLRRKLEVGPFALIARARADRKTFLTVLESEGYDSGKVTITIDGHTLSDPALPDLLRKAPASPPARVRVAIAKGPLYHVGAVSTPGLADPAAAAALGVSPGEPATAAPLVGAAVRLETRLRNLGYAFAKVSPPVAEADDATHTLSVTYPVSMGPRVDVGSITFTGMQRMNGRFMARHIALKPGQRYSQKALDASRDQLLGLGVFSSVTASTAAAPRPAGQVPVTFTVRERKRHTVALGASYSSDLGIDANVSWTDRDLFGEAQSLTLSLGATGIAGSGRSQTATFGKHTYVVAPGYDAKATYRVPDFIRPGQSLVATIEALKQYLPAYSRTAFLGSAAIAHPLAPHLTLDYGAGFVFEKVNQQGVSRTYRLLQLPVTLSYNTANSLLNPTRGVKLALHVTPTLALGAGAKPFVITEFTGSTYINLEAPGRGVLALHGVLGRIFGASQFQIPPDQRFYAGGTGTVRGFTYQTVGPLFPDGIPEGGTAIDALETEFRQRIGKHFGVAPFIDAGQVSANGTPFTGTLRVGAGLGLLYYTGIGPLRVDVGVPLNRAPGSSSFAVYIGLGQAF